MSESSGRPRPQSIATVSLHVRIDPELKEGIARASTRLRLSSEKQLIERALANYVAAVDSGEVTR